MSEAICKTKQGTGQKILTPKQMLQRLLIALGQQKAGNQSSYIKWILYLWTFKIKTGYYLELLIPETTKLLGSSKNKITKVKNGENVPHLEITELVLVQCNIVNNGYQQDSRVLYAFVPNKPFGNLLEIAPTNFILLKTFNSQFQTMKIWFTDQNNQPLEIEDRVNLTLVIKYNNHYKNEILSWTQRWNIRKTVWAFVFF